MFVTSFQGQGKFLQTKIFTYLIKLYQTLEIDLRFYWIGFHNDGLEACYTFVPTLHNP